MKFMNEYDIADAVRQHARHPVLGAAARFLADFRDEVNAHSDGWPYWSAPVKAAAKLMVLIDETGEKATEADLKRALAPIKAFMTRKGIAAGMRMPELKTQLEMDWGPARGRDYDSQMNWDA